MSVEDSFRIAMQADQILSLRERSEVDWEKMSHLAHELKEIAQRYNIVFVYPYLCKSIPDDGVPIGAMDRFIDPPPAMQGVTQLPCKPAGWSKFGSGCPFCEAYLNLYPEDSGEGGIE